MSRLDQLEAMLREEPDDLFLKYALAMELDSQGQSERSLALYDELESRSPPHLPAIFRKAQLFVRLGQIDRARSALNKGIAESQRQGDHHTAAEMDELLRSLNIEDDEF